MSLKWFSSYPRCTFVDATSAEQTGENKNSEGTVIGKVTAIVGQWLFIKEYADGAQLCEAITPALKDQIQSESFEIEEPV